MARKSDFRKPKKTMLIIVEGETELIYFKQLRADNRLMNLTIEPKVSPRKDPESIVERADIENLKKEFDYTWCIFDLDTIEKNKNSYESAKLKAKKNNYKLAESFPCFEIWFLLHCIYKTKYYKNYSELESDLCKFIPDYCKKQDYLKKKNIYNFLKDKLSIAIKNCQKLEQYNKNEKIKLNSKCDIYKVIINIDEIAS